MSITYPTALINFFNRPQDRYSIDIDGNLRDENGDNITRDVLDRKEGYTVRQTLPEELQKLIQDAQTIQSLDIQKISPESVASNQIQFEYQIEGHRVEKPVPLGAGENLISYQYGDAQSGQVDLSWDVYSEAFLPNLS